jgi:beta-galactosidase
MHTDGGDRWSPAPPEPASRLWQRLGGLAYGADYNPEQWDESTWAEDMKLMAEAGVNLVSVGIFGWAALQPGPSRFEWGWLDRVLDMLSGAGVSACLATATASPPPWLVREHPEILPVDEDGRTLWHGSRQHYCPSSAAFGDAAAALVEALASRYAGHPALAAWHVGNEYGCHVSRCYCDQSAAAFRRWLQERYGDVDTLNRAWSTAFWSQRYSSWEEVIPPRRTPTFPNPSQQLDFWRFSSDALRACFTREADILRRHAPAVPVTTNFLSYFKPVDAYSWAQHEDFVSLDSYPDPADPDAAERAAFAFDMMRGASGGAPWLLMEQAPSAVNWRLCNRPKPPGLYRLWSWQAIAHGANGAMSFQWRASRGGAEKFHSAMVPHAGPSHPLYRQAAAVGRELGKHRAISSTRPVPAEAAILFDWHSWWALELPSHPSTWVTLVPLAQAYYQVLWQQGIPVDIIPPTADLSRHRLVIAPNLYLLDGATATGLSRWAEAGGQLVLGFFSGIVDGHDTVHPGAYPGPLRDLIGAAVDQFWPLDAGQQVGLRGPSGEEHTGTWWSEEITLADARPLAWFSGGALDGRPAVTEAARGRGAVRYLGTLPDPNCLAGLVAGAAAAAGVRPLLAEPPPGIEVTARSGGDGEYLFILNHGEREQVVTVPDWPEAVIGRVGEDGRTTVAPSDLAVLRRPAHPASGQVPAAGR